MLYIYIQLTQAPVTEKAIELRGKHSCHLHQESSDLDVFGSRPLRNTRSAFGLPVFELSG